MFVDLHPFNDVTKLINFVGAGHPGEEDIGGLVLVCQRR